MDDDGVVAQGVGPGVPLAGLVGCGGEEPMEAPPPVGPGSTAGPAGGPPGNPAVKKIMEKVGKGPNSLTPRLGKELAETPPPWETIQAESKEYVQEAGELARQEPTKGPKESWEKLTAAWIKSAGALDAAARAKDQAAAKAAHEALKNSCMECHRAHRTMGLPGAFGPGGPGGRGFGPPPGGGPLPGGPPPA